MDVISVVAICFTIFVTVGGAYIGIIRKLDKLQRHDADILKHIATQKFALLRLFRNYINPGWVETLKLKKNQDHVVDQLKKLQQYHPEIVPEMPMKEMAAFETKVQEGMRKKYDDFKELLDLATRKEDFSEETSG